MGFYRVLVESCPKGAKGEMEEVGLYHPSKLEGEKLDIEGEKVETEFSLNTMCIGHKNLIHI